jgi:hypothetical protein
MGLFRPARTISTPSGAYWEIFVSKTALPAWREGQRGEWEPAVDERINLFTLPFAVGGVIWSLMRFAALLLLSFVKGRRSRAVRIEAVNPWPVREVYLWSTTDMLADGVLEEIVAGLREDRFVQPTGAVYSGLQSG